MDIEQEKQEEAYIEEISEEEFPLDDSEQEEHVTDEEEQETEEPVTKTLKLPRLRFSFSGRSSFIYGIAVGLGFGFIGTFIIVWISLFFAPQLPPDATYESLLAIFIYPLIYLLAIGLITLTAGIVREYYSARPSENI